MSRNSPQPLNIIILSGGTGRTGKQVVESALAQFEMPNVQITTESNVRGAAHMQSIIRQAKKNCSIIFHTVVATELREVITRETESLMVPTVDILGPVINVLADQLGVEPRNQPGLSHELNREQFERIDAVDFSLAHDDGQRPEDYDSADVVLVGVSRVSKSVTSLFLALRGIRAANVVITPEFGAPQELLDCDPKKVIALKMNAHRLQMLREARGARWRGAMQNYAEPQHISLELAEFNKLVAQHDWQCIDVSYKAVEDVAADISRMLGFVAKP